MLRNININPPPLFEPDAKRKRRPAGTPDPDAEVVFLSPETLLESDKFVCEICNQGFQRDQNLQMHRRRHKVPWKLIKRETENPIPRKRVFVCPEPSCLHHDPRHALGDLVGIKKHFRRKHSNHKEWVCQKCSKGYAVQSDFKAHVKTCGTRGHSCDCGRVFSRVESFIEHQDVCSFGWLRGTPAPPALPEPLNATANYCNYSLQAPNLELQLLTNGGSDFTAPPQFNGGRIFIGKCSTVGSSNTATSEDPTAAAAPAARIVKEQARELLQTAMTEKAAAEEARRQARQQIEVAEEEFSNARRIRRQAQAELEKAQALMKHYSSPSSTAMVITCHSCKHNFHAVAAAAVQPAAVPVPPPWQPLIPPSSVEAKLGVNYISAALRDWEIRKR